MLRQRHSIRLKGYDYAQSGAYFVTLCAHQRKSLFGNIVDGEMHLNEAGGIIETCLYKLPRFFSNARIDQWVIMPNHLHMILVLNEQCTGEATTAKSQNTMNNLPVVASPLRPRGTISGSLNAIVQNIKSVTTIKINNQGGSRGVQVWQRNYYEHIIRDEADYQRIAEYILNNPQRWELDSLYTNQNG
jgi:REP element-mobilizing transposase RayT